MGSIGLGGAAGGGCGAGVGQRLLRGGAGGAFLLDRVLVGQFGVDEAGLERLMLRLAIVEGAACCLVVAGFMVQQGFELCDSFAQGGSLGVGLCAENDDRDGAILDEAVSLPRLIGPLLRDGLGGGAAGCGPGAGQSESPAHFLLILAVGLRLLRVEDFALTSTAGTIACIGHQVSIRYGSEAVFDDDSHRLK